MTRRREIIVLAVVPATIAVGFFANGFCRRAETQFHGDRIRVMQGLWLDATPVTTGAYVSFLAGRQKTSEARTPLVFSLRAQAFVAEPNATAARPDGQHDARPDAPATQVTLVDAAAFCAAKGGRLPRYQELLAARNQDPSPLQFNHWQGAFPTLNTLRDGYLFASPVRAYPSNSLGFFDLWGNVWQWTADTRGGQHRLFGGSFLCDAAYCRGYLADEQQWADPEQPSMHIGFRCAYSD